VPDGDRYHPRLTDRFPDGVRSRIEEFDDAIDRLFDTVRGHPVIDRMFYSASALGDFAAIWHLLSWAPVSRSSAQRRAATEVSMSLAVESVLVNGLIKSLFKRSRPVQDGPRPHHLRQPRTSSFPSGHASAAMVAATMLGRERRWGWLFYIPALIVASSRIHVRIHHASDVAGGLVTGLLLGRALKWLWSDRRR